MVVNTPEVIYQLYTRSTQNSTLPLPKFFLVGLFQTYKQDFRANLTLATPIMAGQIGQILVNIADNVMVGRLGAAELAAVSLANAVFIALLVVGMGISFALPPLIAEADSRNENQLISQFFKHSLIINFIYAFVAIGLIELLIPTMHNWKQEPEVVELAIPYLRISALSMIPFMIFQTFRCYSDGRSETLPPMYAMLSANVINIALNYLLIYGNFGAPALGVTGAALGTMIARICMLALLIIILMRWKQLWKDIRTINFKQYQKKLFNKLLHLGVPTSLQGFFEVTAFGAAAVMAGQISKEAQAAHQIAINLASISFLICTGLAMAATIRVGNQLGHRSLNGVRRAGFSAILQVAFFMFCTSVIYISLRYFLPSLYINNQEVINIAAGLLILASIFQIPDGVQVTSTGALRGLQDVVIPTIITFVAYWIIALPTSYWLAFKQNMGAAGIWTGLTFGLTITATFMTLRFHSYSKRIFKKTNRKL